MEEIVNVIINNGACIGCLVYFMFRDFKFMNLITTTLTNLQTTLDLTNKSMSNLQLTMSNIDDFIKKGE